MREEGPMIIFGKHTDVEVFIIFSIFVNVVQIIHTQYSVYPVALSKQGINTQSTPCFDVSKWAVAAPSPQ